MSETWRALKPILLRSGYLGVNLHRDQTKNRRLIHHLVLAAFVGPRPPGLVCCHADGDPANNRVDNLRWDTQKANAADTIRHGRRKFGEEAGSRLTGAEVMEIRRRYALGVPMSRLGSAYGVSGPAIMKIVRGQSWKHLLPRPDPPRVT